MHEQFSYAISAEIGVMLSEMWRTRLLLGMEIRNHVHNSELYGFKRVPQSTQSDLAAAAFSELMMNCCNWVDA